MLKRGDFSYYLHRYENTALKRIKEINNAVDHQSQLYFKDTFQV